MRHRSPSLQARAILAALLRPPIDRHYYEPTKLVGLSSSTIYLIFLVP